MEQTLGKRIVAQRKRLGLTQDQLAERLGVTAQAVSKWENDQSCPDIAMLPKLAEIFGVTTDELLGVERKEVHEAEIVERESDAEEPDGIRVQNGTWEFKWDSGRKSSIGIAVWVLLVGGMLLFAHYIPCNYFTFWNVLWTTALLVFGLFGLYPKFSFIRLGCALFGGYFLLEYSGLLHINMGMSLILPILLLLFGLSLLVEALRKPGKGVFSVTHNGKSTHKSYCEVEGERFFCATTFGENERVIQLPRLAQGTAEVSFGELTVDLTGCQELADGCRVELKASFGELTLLVPGRFRVEQDSNTAFASVEIKGAPDPDAGQILYADCDASFGEIEIRYV